MEKHDTILLACTNAENRRHLCFVLNERYNLLETSTMEQTIRLWEQNKDCIVAVVLGTSILNKDESIEKQNEQFKCISEEVPIILITDGDDSKTPGMFFQYDVADVIPIDYDIFAMLRRIETITEVYLHRNNLEEMVQEQKDILRRSNDTVVGLLSSLIEHRSIESGHHILRIRNYTKILMDEVMRHCPEYQLDERLVTIVSSASALHDIGKTAIPDAILLKEGPLTQDEWAVMKSHAIKGCQILDNLAEVTDHEYLRYAHNICHYHHERWDGNGYPDGLKGEQIPICAQVVGLADAYEALTTQRVYKEAYSFDKAVNMILKGECGAFSPKLLECFKNVMRSFEELTKEYADGRAPEDTVCDMTLPEPEIEFEENALERVWGKYYALVHYVNAFLVEINLDRELFHIVYNPYPEITQLESIDRFPELVDLMLNHIVVPEEREKMKRVIEEDMPAFVNEDLRRAIYHFHYQSRSNSENNLFEMTLLRIAANEQRRSLAVIVRKISDYEPHNIEKQIHYIPASSTYICRNDREFTLVELGTNATGIGDYTEEEIWSGFGGRLLELIHPEDRTKVSEEFKRQLQYGNEVRVEHRVILKSGRAIWVTNKSHLVMGDDGRENLHCSLIDISHIQSEYKELQKRHGNFREILKETLNVLFIWDVEKNQISFSDTWEEMFDFVPEQENVYEMLAQSSHIHPDDVPLVLDRAGNLMRGSLHENIEVRMSARQGKYSWYRIRANAKLNESGELDKITGIITNIDAEKNEEKVLKSKAENDSLTKLLNKTAGRKYIEEYLSHYPKGVNCAMLIIDLDDFKQINDKYGHLFGDAVLANVAKEIRNQFREKDIMSRIGGDEFMVLVRGLSDRGLLEKRCRQFIDSLEVDLRGQYKKLQLSCSIGIAVCPEHGINYYELFNCADQALYQAKARGKNAISFYEKEDEKGLVKQNIRLTAVNNRIDSDEEPGLAEDNIVRHLFRMLYAAKDEEKAIQDVISMMGERMNVSRVYIFENSEDNRFCSNTFEWCNAEIQPEIENLQNVSYEKDIPNYMDNFNEQGIFYCPDVTTLPKPVCDILEPQGIKSMLQCAMRYNGEFKGYIGFDECKVLRLWTKEEIHMLSYFSEILSLFLLKHREYQRSLASVSEPQK